MVGKNHKKSLEQIFDKYDPQHYYISKGNLSKFDILFWCSETLHAGRIIETPLDHGTLNYTIDEIPEIPWASEVVYVFIVYCPELNSYYLVTEEDLDKNGNIFIRIEHLRSRTVKYMNWKQNHRITKELNSLC